MKLKTLGVLVALGALGAAVPSCSQAKVVCTVGHAGSGSSYAVKYYAQTSPVPACAVPGEVIGFETYHPAGGGDDLTQPDFSVPTIVAFQSESILNTKLDKESKGSMDAAPDHKPYAIGPFATVEPENDMCTIPDATLKQAEQHFPKIDAIPPMPPDDPGAPAEPDTDIKYTWKNVKLLVTSGAQGTQFTADLNYSTTDDTGTCTVDYKVLGVWPQIDCTGTIQVDNPAFDPSKPEDPDTNPKQIDKSVPNPVACCPGADPNGGRATGSGINPDFPLKCDPDLFLCVLDAADASKFPLLSPGWADDTGKHPECKLTPAPSAGTGM